MPFEISDLTVALALPAGLVLVRSLRRQIRSMSVRCYDHISGGLVVLSFAAVARLYQAGGLFGSVPFLSQAIFFDLAYWIAVIAGATFVISGVADWLPMARDYRRYHRRRVEHLDLLRKVVQLVGLESRIERILTSTLQYMTHHMEFKAGAVYRCSPSRQMLKLESITGAYENERTTLGSVELNPDSVCSGGRATEPKTTEMLIGFPAEIDPPVATLPIMVRRRPVGFFVLWDDRSEPVDADDLLTLRLVTDVIARKIDADRVRLQHRAESADRAWRERLKSELIRAENTRRRMKILAERLSELTEFDRVALLLVDQRARSVRRYTSGAAGRVLVETGLPVPSQHGFVGEALETKAMNSYPDLDNDRQPDRTELLCGDPVRSLIVAPFVSGNRFTPVLLIASTQSSKFGARVRNTIASLGPAIKAVVEPEERAGADREETARIDRLRRLWAKANADTDSLEVLESIATAISNETSADLVRVSKLDDTGSFLESKALITSRAHDGMVPGNGKMIFSLMPLHDQVMTSGRGLTVDETTIESAMPGIERRQSLVESVRSVLLTPMMSAEKVIGVISIGSFDGTSLDPTRRAFVQAAADLLASRVQRPEAPIEEPEPFERYRVEIPARALRRSLLDDVIKSSTRLEEPVMVE